MNNAFLGAVFTDLCVILNSDKNIDLEMYEIANLLFYLI